MPKSQAHHLAMANTYLRNAVRSLAGADGQLPDWKAWADVQPRTVDELWEAMVRRRATGQWPWQDDPTVNTGTDQLLEPQQEPPPHE